MLSASRLDAVTVDSFRTLVDLADPVPALGQALRERGVERDAGVVRRAFGAEVEHYLPRAHTGRDPESLAALRSECAQVFLSALEAPLDAAEFAPAFVGALAFEVLPGAAEALDQLRAGGLALACVANWDVSLAEYLDRAGVARRFDVVLSSAEASALKPDPRIFRLALERVGVEPGRALHIGDDDVDRDGAAAAGLAFAEVPLATLPARLGIVPP